MTHDEQAVEQAKRLPKGYYLTSLMRGNGRGWIVATEGKNDWIVQNQRSPKEAVDRALAVLSSPKEVP